MLQDRLEEDSLEPLNLLLLDLVVLDNLLNPLSSSSQQREVDYSEEVSRDSAQSANSRIG